MTKKINLDPKWVMLLVWLLLVVLICWLSSCNPVKQVLKDEKKIDKVWEAGVLKDRCQYDSDTTYLPGRIDSVYIPIRVEKKVFDTNAYNELIERMRRKNDSDCLTSMQMSYTAGFNDAIDKVSKDKVPVKRPDTALIRKADRSKIDLLDKIIASKDSVIAAAKQIIKEKQAEVKEQKQRANTWRFRFWLLIVIALVVIFRKPIIKTAVRFISPIKF